MNNKKQSTISLELFHAVEGNEIAAVQTLIKDDCDVNVQDREECTPLMRASLLGYTDLVDLLLHSGANTAIHDKLGKTALHYAAQEYHADVAHKLLEAGSSVDSQDTHGNTPLGNAVFYSQGRGAMISLLRQYGANENLANRHGVTPFGLARTIANYDVLQHFKDEAGTMCTITITGWKPRFNKIALTQAIRSYTGVGLAEAKRCTDQILENKLTTFENLTPKVAEAFLKEIREIGAVGQINHPSR